MDHALVRYKLPELYGLVYRCLRTYLVDEAGHSRTLAPEYAAGCAAAGFPLGVKGLVLDLEHGDLLRLDCDGRVRKALHGVGAWLDAAARRARYGDGAYAGFAALMAGEKSKRFFPFVTYFDIPAAFLVAQLVDLVDAAAGAAGAGAGGYAGLLDDLFKAFNHNFLPDSFKERRGGYFPALIDDTARYVEPTPGAVAALKVLAARRNGDAGGGAAPAVAAAANGEGADGGAWTPPPGWSPRLFMVTNSHADYTNLLMRHVFGADWRALFDVVVCVAGKNRGFFAPPAGGALAERPFYEIDPATDREKGAPVAPGALERGGHYAQGTAAELQDLFLRIARDDGAAAAAGEAAAADGGGEASAHGDDDDSSPCAYPFDCDAALAAVQRLPAEDAPAPPAGTGYAAAVDHTRRLAAALSIPRAVRPAAARAAAGAGVARRVLYAGDHIVGDVARLTALNARNRTAAARPLFVWDPVAVVEEAVDEQRAAAGGDGKDAAAGVTVAAEWGSFFWCDAEEPGEDGAGGAREAPSCWAELLARTGAAVTSTVEALLVDGSVVPMAPAYGGLDYFMCKTCFEG